MNRVVKCLLSCWLLVGCAVDPSLVSDASWQPLDGGALDAQDAALDAALDAGLDASADAFAADAWASDDALATDAARIDDALVAPDAYVAPDDAYVAPDAYSPFPDAGPPAPGAPRVLSLDPSVPYLTIGTMFTLSALVTDPDGLGDIVGGRLFDPSGAFAGVFVQIAPGSYTVNTVYSPAPAIDTAAGGVDVTYQAVFTDTMGLTGQRTLVIRVRCPDGTQAICNNACVDLQTDLRHCGTCDVAVVAPRTACRAGVPGCPVATDTFCAASNACVDTRTDAQNCGACGNDVTPRECVGGAAQCPQSYETYCDASRSCANLDADSENCGSCGHALPTPLLCVGGVGQCPYYLDTFCPGTSGASGSCTDLQSDASNCGTCGHAVAASQTCVAGAAHCSFGTMCATGCTGDVNNCGGCGNVCPAGSAPYVSGAPLCSTRTCIYTGTFVAHTATPTSCAQVCTAMLGSVGVCTEAYIPTGGTGSTAFACTAVPSAAHEGSLVYCSCNGRVF